MWNSINAECMVWWYVRGACFGCLLCMRVWILHTVRIILPATLGTNEWIRSDACNLLFKPYQFIVCDTVLFINILNCLLVWESTHAPTTFTHYCKPTHMMTILVGTVPQTEVLHAHNFILYVHILMPILLISMPSSHQQYGTHVTSIAIRTRRPLAHFHAGACTLPCMRA